MIKRYKTVQILSTPLKKFGPIVLCFVFIATSAFAGNYKITSPNNALQIADYAMEGETTTIEYKINNDKIYDNLGNEIRVSGSGSVVLNCNGDTNLGGWEANYEKSSGQCWDQAGVTYDRTAVINGVNVIEHMHLAPKSVAESLQFTPKSKCIGNTVQGQPGDIKRYCVFGNSGLKGNTGDDMFRIDPGGEGFLEYIGMGDPADLTVKNRLKYFKRTGGKDQGMMIPAGPAGTFTDYANFITSIDRNLVDVKGACFQGEISLCNQITTTRESVTCLPEADYIWDETAQECQPRAKTADACGEEANTCKFLESQKYGAPLQCHAINGYWLVHSVKNKSETENHYTWDCDYTAPAGSRGCSGKLSFSCSAEKPEINTGFCGTNAYECKPWTGQVPAILNIGDKKETSTHYTWACVYNGNQRRMGFERCTLEKQPELVNGKCSNKVNECITGNSINQRSQDNRYWECNDSQNTANPCQYVGSVTSTWDCEGTNGGTLESCSIDGEDKTWDQAGCGTEKGTCTGSWIPTKVLEGNGKYAWTCKEGNGYGELGCSMDITPTCGNGIREDNEACDYGSANIGGYVGSMTHGTNGQTVCTSKCEKVTYDRRQCEDYDNAGSIDIGKHRYLDIFYVTKTHGASEIIYTTDWGEIDPQDRECPR